MSDEKTPESNDQEQQAPINVEGDAVVNNAPDGGGVDNNAGDSQSE